MRRLLRIAESTGGSDIRRLEPRLELIRRWCGSYSVIADVGAHHGHLIRQLQSSDRRLYATELTFKGYQELAERTAGCAVTTLRGDGIVPLTGIADLQCIVISGMGYDTILGILERHSQLISAPQVIVQPAQGGHLMHRAICQNRWTMLRAELVVYRSRFYPTWLLDLQMKTAGAVDPALAYVPIEFRGQKYYIDWLKDLDRQLDGPLRYNRDPKKVQEREWLNQEIKQWGHT